jgi:hypothetical protein
MRSGKELEKAAGYTLKPIIADTMGTPLAIPVLHGGMFFCIAGTPVETQDQSAMGQGIVSI